MAAGEQRGRGGPRFSGAPLPPLADDPSATLRVQVVMGMFALGASIGVPLDELTRLAGVTPSLMSDPDATIGSHDAAKVMARLEEALPGEPLSPRLLALAPPSVFGLLDLAAQSASTIGEALEVYLRYQRLTSSHYQGWLERVDGLVAYRCRHLEPLDRFRHPVEMGIGYAHRVLTRAGAVDHVVEVHFAHPAIGSPDPYEAHYGCPVYFESFGHALVLEAEALERPMLHSDPVLSRSVRARLERELAEGEDPVAGLRRDVAAHARPASYTAAGIARRMGRSLRSLQRDAARAGTTLSQLVEDIRMARARELLLDDSLSVDEVGFLVDYSERAAFSRAFKRATGETPADFRRRGAN